MNVIIFRVIFMIKEFNKVMPQTEKSAFIADNSMVIGDAFLAENTSVWFGAVVRADSEKITIGENSNIQDNCTIHCSKGFPVKIGSNVTVGHNAVVHGCTIGDNTLIGMNATILNGAVIGKNCVVGAGALVTENKVFPDNSLIIGVPAKAVKSIDRAAEQSISENARHYVFLAEEYAHRFK